MVIYIFIYIYTARRFTVGSLVDASTGQGGEAGGAAPAARGATVSTVPWKCREFRVSGPLSRSASLSGNMWKHVEAL